jgi:hypothetical protein
MHNGGWVPGNVPEMVEFANALMEKFAQPGNHGNGPAVSTTLSLPLALQMVINSVSRSNAVVASLATAMVECDDRAEQLQIEHEEAARNPSNVAFSEAALAQLCGYCGLPWSR